MIWIRSLTLSVWLCLLMAFLAEPAIGPAVAANLNRPVSADEPISHYDQPDPFGDFHILQNNTQITAPVPAVRAPFFKWKSFLPERYLDPFSCTNSYPELVQDSWQCPAVAFVLFPYHEFL